MFELLPLLKGWEYDIKTIINPETYTSNTITLIDKVNIKGWLASVELISNDPNLLVNLYLDNTLIGTGTPQNTLTTGSKLLYSSPNTVVYGQYITGTNTALYGLVISNPNGYPFTSSLRIQIETSKSPLYIDKYKIVIIKITDIKLFRHCLRILYSKDYEIESRNSKESIKCEQKR